MPTALLCAATSLDEQLSSTILWRHDVEKHTARRLEEAMTMAVASRPELIVVDLALPRALELVESIRRDASTRRTSVVVLAPGEFEPSEVEFLEAGANAILRFPPSGEWDERLDRLMRVPARREARFPVHFRVEASLVQETVVATARNLSLHGILLQSPVALELGGEVRFGFELPDGIVRGIGRVVRSSAGGNYGVCFDRLGGSAQEPIRRYVATLPAH